MTILIVLPNYLSAALVILVTFIQHSVTISTGYFFGTVYIHFGTVQIVFRDGSGTVVKKVSVEPWFIVMICHKPSCLCPWRNRLKTITLRNPYGENE